MLDEGRARRLAFIRYMHTLAAEQSRQAEPFCAVSVLTFHDAIDLFLQLAKEHLDTSKKAEGFMSQWDHVQQALPSGHLTQKASIRRLNSARNNFKHEGIRPSREDIEGFRVAATNFFSENTPTVFSIEFTDATMIHFVVPYTARRRLEQAEKLKAQGRLDAAFTEVGLAFYEVVEEPLARRGLPSMGTYPRFKLKMFGYRNDVSQQHDRASQETANLFEDLHSQLADISRATAVLGLGLDPTKFARFKALVPPILQTVGGQYSEVSGPARRGRDEASFDACMDFVIETAVRINGA